VEIHVSLVGRKDLTGEIYRHLRRPRTAAATTFAHEAAACRAKAEALRDKYGL
jgi:hypothetical protein